MKKHSKRKIILAVLLFATVVNMTIYEANLHEPVNLKPGETQEYVDNYQNSTGNYVAICEDNDWRNFPFITGGRLKLLSIPDGKEYTVADDKSWLTGFREVVIHGSHIYYHDSWDGSPKELYTVDLNDRRHKKELWFIYEQPYYISEDRIFYLDDNGYDLEDEEGGYYLIEQNIDTSERKTLMKKRVDHFICNDDFIYCYRKKDGRLSKREQGADGKELASWYIGKYDILGMKLKGDSEVFIQTAKDGILLCDGISGETRQVVDNGKRDSDLASSYETSFLHIRGEKLYYCDSSWNIYCNNLKTGVSKKIIDRKAVNYMSLSREESHDIWILCSWCDDYIVMQM